ncbi:MAG: hypothetical protein GXP62_06475 [Oligoflexia bacterium]|nr:hypothetical protein [Oligoflexia bacterium]
MSTLAAKARLENASRSYHAGRRDLAISLLTALVRDDAWDPAMVQQARILMGEIFLVQGNEAAARDAFEQVLANAPETTLDPFEHPPDICAFFELVKASGSWRPTPLPPPKPVSPWLPLGISQLRQGRPVAGTLIAISQGASCGLSAGLFAWLALNRRYGSQDVPGFDANGNRLWTVETLRSRRAAQIALTAGCYTSVSLGFADAWVSRRRSKRDTSDTPHPVGTQDIQNRRSDGQVLVLHLSGRF